MSTNECEHENKQHGQQESALGQVMTVTNHLKQTFEYRENNYTARFSLHQVHDSLCTKEYYTKYSWKALSDVYMVSEGLRVVPRCRRALL